MYNVIHMRICMHIALELDIDGYLIMIMNLNLYIYNYNILYRSISRSIDRYHVARACTYTYDIDLRRGRG
jgi:hypothetical protein